MRRYFLPVDRAIIFDVDGTLSKTEKTHREAFNRASQRAALVVDDLESLDLAAIASLNQGQID